MSYYYYGFLRQFLFIAIIASLMAESQAANSWFGEDLGHSQVIHHRTSNDQYFMLRDRLKFKNSNDGASTLHPFLKQLSQDLIKSQQKPLLNSKQETAASSSDPGNNEKLGGDLKTAPVCNVAVFVNTPKELFPSLDSKKEFKDQIVSAFQDIDAYLLAHFNMKITPTYIRLFEDGEAPFPETFNSTVPLDSDEKMSPLLESFRSFITDKSLSLFSYDSVGFPVIQGSGLTLPSIFGKQGRPCANYFLTPRDFKGQMGLAYVKGIDPEANGDNTAIVSYFNHGRRIPFTQWLATILHETLHLLGASHDDTKNQDSPADQQQQLCVKSRFLMNSMVLGGNRNLFRMSECTKKQVNEHLPKIKGLASPGTGLGFTDPRLLGKLPVTIIAGKRQ